MGEIVYGTHNDNLKSGKKKREYRLNDDKRKQVRIGDTIRFLKLPNLDEEFVVDVKNIEVFSNWYDCYSKYYDEDFKDRYSSVDKTLTMVVITQKKNLKKMVVLFSQ